VVEAVLLEKQVLLLSAHYSILTIVSELILTLIFPFTWRHVYIPLLPKKLIDFLNAPMPFLIGTHVSFVKRSAPVMKSLLVVDLDNNTITCGSSKTKARRGSKINRHRRLSGLDRIVRNPNDMLPRKERKKLLKTIKPMGNYYRCADDRGSYETKCLNMVDLAFPNAPLPDEVEQKDLLDNVYMQVRMYMYLMSGIPYHYS